MPFLSSWPIRLPALGLPLFITELPAMKRTTALREKILSELDGFLALMGYRRPKRDQSWRSKQSTEQTFFVHLNFGLYERSDEVLIIPSVSLRSQWLSDREVECGMIQARDSVHHAQFGERVTALSGHSYDYTVGDDPERIAKALYKDIVDYGMPYLERIKDYNLVINLLRSENVKDWPVICRSDRARYLPLLLMMTGKQKEGVEALLSMEADISGQDQVIPKFEHFKSWFMGKFTVTPA